MKKIIDYISKNWIYFLVAFLLLGTNLFGIFKKRPTKNKTAAADDVLRVVTGFTAQKKAELSNLALQMSTHLGTGYAWFDPRSWSENDKDVFVLLKPLNQKEFDLVAKLYFQVYAKGNDLRADLAKFLDSKYYEKLPIK